ELAGDSRRFHNLANAIAVDGPTFAGAVEVYHVQIGGALLHPVPRHGGRFRPEHRFLSVISLPQAHALAASQIDGRDYLHVISLTRSKTEIGLKVCENGILRLEEGIASLLTAGARRVIKLQTAVASPVPPADSSPDETASRTRCRSRSPT